jgi:hypothetical protein
MRPVDRREYWMAKFGRALYLAYTQAMSEGARVDELEEISRDMLEKAFRVMDEAGISN